MFQNRRKIDYLLALKSQDCLKSITCSLNLGMVVSSQANFFFKNQLRIITARIRRMREGNSFSLSTLAGGTPSQVWMGGGGTPSQVQMGGYPIPGPDRRGYPIPGLDGRRYPIPGLDGGYPILLMGGTWDGVPLPHQQSKHLLCGGRCASYVIFRFDLDL